MYTTARTRSYAVEGELAYAPVIEWLRSAAIQRILLHLDTAWRTELARLLPELAPQSPAVQRPAASTERWQRLRLFEAMARALLHAKPPLLLLIDDLQWVDAGTVEWHHQRIAQALAALYSDQHMTVTEILIG